MPVKRPIQSAEQTERRDVITNSDEESIQKISQLHVFFAAMFLNTGLMRRCKSQTFLSVRSSFLKRLTGLKMTLKQYCLMQCINNDKKHSSLKGPRLQNLSGTVALVCWMCFFPETRRSKGVRALCVRRFICLICAVRRGC